MTTRAGGSDRAPAGHRLDRERIVVAGLAYVDEFDLAGLTMRRLGTALGVQAMALYRHVPSKEDLLDAIVDSMVAEMRADPQLPGSPEHGWQDFLEGLAHTVRRVALAHPHAFPLLLARPPEAPWLRRPLRDLAGVESFLAGLLAEGFDEEQAVDVYRAFTSFLLGHLIVEVSLHDDAQAATPDAGAGPPGATLEAFPTVDRLRPRLAVEESSRDFEEALASLLERISRLRGERRGGA